MAEILFVCDASPTVGGGHVMRSLTLAGELARRGLKPVFAATPAVASVLDRFDADRFERRAPGEALGGAAAVVFDHYGLVADDHRALAQDRSAVVIDDLADRPLGADLLLDPSPERIPEHYAGKVAPGVPLLLGPAYALVRPVFAEARQAALARRAATPAGPTRILVSLGLTDVGGITGKIASRIQPRLFQSRFGNARLTLVLGSGAPSLEPMRRLAGRDPRLEVVVDASDMARLVSEADLVVGAGGSSTWERAVLGAPSLVVVLADNQAAAAQALEARGAIERVDARAPDFEAAFDRAFTGLLASPDRRARLSRASAALCDGSGAARVADAVQRMLGAG